MIAKIILAMAVTLGISVGIAVSVLLLLLPVIAGFMFNTLDNGWWMVAQFVWVLLLFHWARHAGLMI